MTKAVSNMIMHVTITINMGRDHYMACPKIPPLSADAT